MSQTQWGTGLGSTSGGQQQLINQGEASSPDLSDEQVCGCVCSCFNRNLGYACGLECVFVFLVWVGEGEG